jgi:hypothetical protein
MDSIPDNAKSLALPEFCAAVMKRRAFEWPPTEGQLAEDFLAHFGIARLGFYDGLVKWCGEVGVDVSTMELPHDLRGVNFWHEKNMSIVMPVNGGCFISREHTLLHEVRELLEGIFAHLGHPTGGGATLESRAEQFAACVRMAMFLESSKDYPVTGLFAVPDQNAAHKLNGIVLIFLAEPSKCLQHAGWYGIADGLWIFENA